MTDLSRRSVFGLLAGAVSPNLSAYEVSELPEQGLIATPYASIASHPESTT